MNDLPWKSGFCQQLHEGVGVELLHVPYSGAEPLLLQHELGPDHGWNARSKGHGLRADLGITPRVITNVVEEDRPGLAVRDSPHDATDTGSTRSCASEFPWIRKNRLEELNRHDLGSMVIDGLDGGHPDILQHVEARKVFFGERHPELGSLDRGEVTRE